MRNMQDVIIKLEWTPAQFTVLWFLTGYMPNAGKCEIKINGTFWDDCHVTVGYMLK